MYSGIVETIIFSQHGLGVMLQFDDWRALIEEHFLTTLFSSRRLQSKSLPVLIELILPVPLLLLLNPPQSDKHEILDEHVNCISDFLHQFGTVVAILHAGAEDKDDECVPKETEKEKET